MADVIISDLTGGSAVDGTELFEAEQGGGSVKLTAADIKTYMMNKPKFAAGSATADSWPEFVNGTLLTTPEANAFENDGTATYFTLNTTNGRAQHSQQHIFRLTANGSAIGPGIADYFGSNSALPTVTNGIYELDFYCVFLKTTAGTVTFTVTNSQTYTSVWGHAIFTGVAGMSLQSSPGVGFGPQTTAASAFPPTGSLTTAVNHIARIKVIAECGTAGNIRLRVTSSAGTVTPLRGSYYTARRLFAGNVGTFVA